MVVNNVDKQGVGATRLCNTHILSGIYAHLGWAGRSAPRICVRDSMERSNNRG